MRCFINLKLDYFFISGDDTKFIECDMLGHANVLPCPDGLVWDESRLSCVYKFTVPGSGTGTGTGTGTGERLNLYSVYLKYIHKFCTL